jgi:hypothetical protein
LALRGFSCTGTLVDVYSQSEGSSSELFQELANQAVNAAVLALDDSTDRNDQLSVEAVNTLESLVFVLKRPVLEEILPKLLLKIKPCFEKVTTQMNSFFSYIFYLGQHSSANCCIFIVWKTELKSWSL